MKQKLLNSFKLRAVMLVAILCAGFTSAWTDSYNVTYAYSDLGSKLSGSYLDASSYWKVPETAGNSATIAIPITNQPTSDLTITFRIATFGNGDNPSSSNTTITAVGTEENSNWSGSGVSNYPSSKNYVDGVMTITKPNTPTTLGGLTITMSVNSGVKIFRLQSITVSYTYGGGDTPTPTTCTVTYDANGGTGSMTDSNSPYNSGATVTVLDNGFTRNGYTFDKWNTASDGNGTDYAPGANFTISANTTLYAQWTENAPAGNYEWVLTDLADLTTDDIFVIVGTSSGTSYSMSNNNGTGNPPAASAVTIENNKITSTVSDNIKWLISGNATDGYVFYPNGNTSTWLYCTASNNGVRVGTNVNKTFKPDNSGYLVHTETGRYLSFYNEQWRCYGNTNNTPLVVSFYIMLSRIPLSRPTM